MCGIFGYVGSEQYAANVVLDGLKLLEYRGYDSWGIAVKKGKKITLEKHVGKIGQASTILPASTLGIGHTRWATHGGVVVKNAHPHSDCTKELAVVHNGIVENYQEIKADLLKKGHIFASDTDTEVIPHLIEENLKTQGFASSVRDAFNRLNGLNALVVAYAPSKEIIAAKTGSPLVVGKTQDGIFIASDASGITKYTQDVLFLKDGEMVILGDSVQLVSLANGKKITPKFEHVSWKIEDVTQGTFAHYMLKEMYDQPTVIRNIAENYISEMKELADVVNRAKGTFFIAAGTAYNACLAGVYLFSKIAKKHVNTAMASEFNYLEDFLTNKSLVIALSQSGETIDVIEPLSTAKKKKSKVASITNALGSTIYRMSDYKLLLGAGPEKAVASTKAYIAKLSILLFLSYALTKQVSTCKKLLLAAADEGERLMEDKQIAVYKKLATQLKKAEHIYIVGRGVSYPTAMEAALKIKEVSYIHTEGLAGGELKHGPIALVAKGTPVLVFAPDDETHDAMISNATEMKARGAYIIGISSSHDTIFDEWIEVKDIGEATVIAQIIPAQFLAYFLAVEKGLDPDKPRNLAKSVTVK